MQQARCRASGRGFQGLPFWNSLPVADRREQHPEEGEQAAEGGHCDGLTQAKPFSQDATCQCAYRGHPIANEEHRRIYTALQIRRCDRLPQAGLVDAVYRPAEVPDKARFMKSAWRQREASPASGSRWEPDCVSGIHVVSWAGFGELAVEVLVCRLKKTSWRPLFDSPAGIEIRNGYCRHHIG